MLFEGRVISLVIKEYERHCLDTLLKSSGTAALENCGRNADGELTLKE